MSAPRPVQRRWLNRGLIAVVREAILSRRRTKAIAAVKGDTSGLHRRGRKTYLNWMAKHPTTVVHLAAAVRGHRIPAMALRALGHVNHGCARGSGRS